MSVSFKFMGDMCISFKRMGVWGVSFKSMGEWLECVVQVYGWGGMGHSSVGVECTIQMCCGYCVVGRW